MILDSDMLNEFASEEPQRSRESVPPAGAASIRDVVDGVGDSTKAESPREDSHRSSHTVSPAVVSLGEVIGRNVPLGWDEAVAVIEELCDSLTPGEGGELAVPDLDGILIDAAGTVRVRHPGRGEEGPTAAGRTLHALLTMAEIPVALRLFVTQSTVPETHGSIREFAKALAYFGKPGRAELIQAVFRRYTEMAASGVQGAEPSRRPPPLPINAKGPERSEESKKPTKTSRRRLPRWLVPATAAASILGVGVWLWSSGRLAGVADGSAAAAVSQAAEAFAEMTGFNASPGEAVAASEEPPATTAGATRRSASNATRTATAPRVRTADSTPTPTPAAAVAPASPEPESSVAASTQQPADAVVATEEGPALAPAAEIVYSTQDADVEPPVLLYPQLPPPVMANSPAGPVNRMEVLVSASGMVERVRLIEGPSRLPDMMLLSGAKMWKFSPALKDGEPVRYRAVLSWAGFP